MRYDTIDAADPGTPTSPHVANQSLSDYRLSVELRYLTLSMTALEERFLSFLAFASVG